MTTIASPQRSPHEALVLRLLRDEPNHSRSSLSEATGLSPTTITKVVAPLIARGLLVEQDSAARGPGRPALTLVPVPGAVTVMGVQLGVGTIKIGLSDAVGRVRSARQEGFDPAAPVEEVIDRTAQLVRELLGDDTGASCIGVGVGAPSPVDEAQRRMLLAINLGWRDVPFADLLEERLGLPVVVDHNVRSMALGEARYGSTESDSVAYVYVKTGLGFGVAVKGQPFSGGSGGESYLGHTRVVENGELCSCGARGCLETMVSEPHLLRRLAEIRPDHPLGPDDNVLATLERWSLEGVAGAAELREQFVRHMANAVATVVNLFTPGAVVLGGIFAAAPQSIIEAIRERTRDQIFPLLRERLQVEAADGSLEAAVRAGAAVGLETLLYR